MKGLVGRKVGMTQIFSSEGLMIPVTVIEVESNVVTQVKTTETDGYEAVQIGYGLAKTKSVTKPLKGHFDKAGVTPRKAIQEFRVENAGSFTIGQEVLADLFTEGDKVDITGISKGKGFAGVIKRHGQKKGPESHGSRYHRRPGSMGSNTSPGRVFKGKNLAGHMGHEQVTIQNLEVIKIDTERNVLLVKGAVPGPKKGLLTIKKTIKQGR